LPHVAMLPGGVTVASSVLLPVWGRRRPGTKMVGVSQRPASSASGAASDQWGAATSKTSGALSEELNSNALAFSLRHDLRRR
jgi:hypothetical protein